MFIASYKVFWEEFMKAIIAILVLTLAVSCGGSKQSVGLEGLELGTSGQEVKIQNFLTEYDEWDDTDFMPSEVVKIDTEKGGNWIVVKHTYSGTSPFEGDRAWYVAYNMDAYSPGNIDNFVHGSVDGFSGAVSSDVYPKDLYAENIVFVPSWDAFYSSGSSESMGTYTPIEEEDRNLWVFETTGSNNKDLEKMGAKIEGIQVEGLQNTLMYYGLSETRSHNMAKLAVTYNKITQKRSLNDREKDHFAQALLGMSFYKASSILVNEGHDALIDQAVEKHDLSPEAVKEILNLL